MSGRSSETSLRSTAKHREFTEFSRSECCKYIVFLIIFTTMVILGRSLDEFNYYVSEEVQTAINNQYFRAATAGERNLAEIDQYFEIWDFLINVAMPVLLIERDAENQVITDSNAKHLVAGQNKLMGAIRLRQLRVKQENCLKTSDAWTCYPEWSSSSEATDETPSGIAWQSSSALHERLPWWGLRTQYPGSGYAVDLPLNRSAAIAEITRLRDTGFIDRATRFVATDFVLFNPTLNLHCIGRISFELAPSGSVLPKNEVKTWRFYRYETTRGTALIVFEIMFLVFVVYFTAEEIYEFKHKGWPLYKQDRWNIADVINLIFFYITIIWRVVEMEKIQQYELLPQDNTYSNLRDLARSFEYEAYLQTVNGFVLYLKLFKYLTFSKRVKFLFSMLRRSSDDLAIFSIVLLVLFLAFGMVGFLAFSTDVNDFRSFPHSVINLLRYTVSEPPYEELSRSNKAFGSFFFVVWGLLMLLILANVFIAILSDSYSVISGEIAAEEEEDFFSSLWRGSIMDKFMKRIKTFRSTDKNKDGKIDATELQAALSVSRSKADKMVSRFDANGDGMLDEAEYNELLKLKTAKQNQRASGSEKAFVRSMSENGGKKDIKKRLRRIERQLTEFLSSMSQEVKLAEGNQVEEEEKQEIRVQEEQPDDKQN